MSGLTRWVSLFFLSLAALAVLVVDWILLVDVVGEDFRRGSGSWMDATVGLVISALLLAIPTVLGGWLHRRHHPLWATLVAWGSLALSWGALNVLSAAFIP